MAENRFIRALVPMACDGFGPSFAAVRLMEGARSGGVGADMFVNRYRMARTDLPLYVMLPGPFGRLPYRKVSALASALLEARYAASIKPGEIGYLFPAASLRLHETLHRRQIPIVIEGINTRMKAAKAVLDAAYDAFGAAPGHGITAARIAEEEAKYALATAIFAPSRAVEAALAGSAFAGRIIATSYGIDTDRAMPRRERRPGTRPVTFLFCGAGSIRKGLHHLLEAWREVPAPARLRIVGRIEPLIAARYRDMLNDDRIEAVGFVQNMGPHFAAADVFVMPSLEEGDPLVTYEAALHGLPIIATPMGGGRMGDGPDHMILVPPGDGGPLLQALQDLAGSADRRDALGTRSRAAVAGHDWRAVGGRRARALQALA